MDGIVLTPLKRIYNPKGDILHAMKRSDMDFSGFGEVYFSMINLGSVKGWKKHNEMTLNLVVVSGEIEFVIYDEGAKTFFNVTLSQDNYQRLTVKPNLWMAFKGLKEGSMLMNLASIEHDASESENLELSKIEYAW